MKKVHVRNSSRRQSPIDTQVAHSIFTHVLTADDTTLFRFRHDVANFS